MQRNAHSACYRSFGRVPIATADDRRGPQMADAPVVKVTVTFEPREDGGLYVYSDDLPGFVLSHLDAHAVLADIEPALSVFLSGQLDRNIVVKKVTDLKEALIRDGVIDPVPLAFRTKRDYVGIAA